MILIKDQRVRFRFLNFLKNYRSCLMKAISVFLLYVNSITLLSFLDRMLPDLWEWSSNGFFFYGGHGWAGCVSWHVPRPYIIGRKNKNQGGVVRDRVNPVSWITNSGSHTPSQIAYNILNRGWLVILFKLYNRPRGFC